MLFLPMINKKLLVEASIIQMHMTLDAYRNMIFFRFIKFLLYLEFWNFQSTDFKIFAHKLMDSLTPPFLIQTKIEVQLKASPLKI